LDAVSSKTNLSVPVETQCYCWNYCLSIGHCGSDDHGIVGQGGIVDGGPYWYSNRLYDSTYDSYTIDAQFDKWTATPK